ncbi:hypothetical protein CsSME_00015046 [Camellia sinensis var. sinensis]
MASIVMQRKTRCQQHIGSTPVGLMTGLVRLVCTDDGWNERTIYQPSSSKPTQKNLLQENSSKGSSKHIQTKILGANSNKAQLHLKRITHPCMCFSNLTISHIS